VISPARNPCSRPGMRYGRTGHPGGEGFAVRVSGLTLSPKQAAAATVPALEGGVCSSVEFTVACRSLTRPSMQRWRSSRCCSTSRGPALAEIGRVLRQGVTPRRRDYALANPMSPEDLQMAKEAMLCAVPLTTATKAWDAVSRSGFEQIELRRLTDDIRAKRRADEGCRSPTAPAVGVRGRRGGIRGHATGRNRLYVNVCRIAGLRQCGTMSTLERPLSVGHGEASSDCIATSLMTGIQDTDSALHGHEPSHQLVLRVTTRSTRVYQRRQRSGRSPRRSDPRSAATASWRVRPTQMSAVAGPAHRLETL
jgi:hypothetical protein